MWDKRDKMTKKLQKELDKKPLVIKNKLYCSINGEKVPKVNKGFITRLNGQFVYNAKYSWFQRVALVDYYHEYFGKQLLKIKDFKLESTERLHIEYLLYYDEIGISPDIDNLWIIPKIFHDTLRDLKFIIDDSKFYINGFSMRYILSPEPSTKKLIINIYKL
jgi:Holliday junction resolvase RusA-like endonuclease